MIWSYLAGIVTAVIIALARLFLARQPTKNDTPTPPPTTTAPLTELDDEILPPPDSIRDLVDFADSGRRSNDPE